MQTEPTAGPAHQTTETTETGARSRERTGRRRVPWWRVVAGGVVLALGVALGVVLLGDDGDDGATTATTATPTTAASAPAPAAPTDAPDAPSGEPVLEDGRHPVYLTGVDVGARTMEFDLIQFLTGDEAVAAWDAAHPDDPGGPPNDYVIVNDNPRLRELPVAGDVAVTVLDWDGGFLPMTIAFEDLPDQLAGDVAPDDAFLGPTPFWLTVDDGAVTAIEEQFIP